MTIDERIEAIGMHLELLSHMHEDQGKRHEEAMAELRANIAKLEALDARLVLIVEGHDVTLEDHENRIDKLEG